MQPRRTFTLHTQGHLRRARHLTSATPRCTTSLLSLSKRNPFRPHLTSSGTFFHKVPGTSTKTRSPDATFQNLHAPFRHLLPSLTLYRQFALHCLVLSLPVRSLLLECGLPCPGYCACLYCLPCQSVLPPCLCFLGSPCNVLVLVLVCYLDTPDPQKSPRSLALPGSLSPKGPTTSLLDLFFEVYCESIKPTVEFIMNQSDSQR